MITNNKTSIKRPAIYLWIIPVICLLLFAFTAHDYKTGRGSVPKIRIDGENDNVPSICPLHTKKMKITNNYGECVNPTTKKKGFHYGIDLAAPEGEIVIVTANGMVVEAQFDTEKHKGNYVIVKHNEIYSTFYGHLKNFTVKPGDKLKKGQVIGYVGNTGVSSGPHLHYEVLKNGERVNPENFMPK